MGKATVQDLIREAEAVLRGAGKEPARLEAEVLLAHVLGRRREWLMAHDEERPTVEDCSRFRDLLEERCAGNPLQYLTHRQEFWSLDFSVDPRTLVPRPESELLVEEAVRRAPRDSRILLDIGTGCGNLAVALATEFPDAAVYAVDRSAGALEVARRNVEAHGLKDRIHLVAGDGFTPLAGFDLEGRVDLVVSNPPYLAEGEFPGLQEEVRDHEPREALVAGKTGEEFYPLLLSGGIRFLRPGGLLILELGLGREPGVSALLRDSEGYGDCQIRKDGAGIDRVAIAVKRGPPDEP